MMSHRLNSKDSSCPHLKPLTFYQEHPRRPQLIVQHLKTEKTELQDRQPYQDCKQSLLNNNKSTVKNNIAMTIVLVQQNQQLITKIQSLRKQIQDEQLKARIFIDNIQKNEKQIARLKQKKEELLQSQQSSLRMQTLNQSQIPSATVVVNSTLNNTWMNEFLNKEELQSLWNTKRQSKSSKINKIEPKVKCFTIDLSTHMNSVKEKKQKEKAQTKLSYSPVDQKQNKLRNDKPIDRNSKKSIVSVAQNAKSKTARLDLKLNLNPKNIVYHQPQKNKALNKAISTLRNAKKLKPNPQL